MPRRKKYSALLEKEDIRRWYDNMARGSQVTTDVYLRRLGNFCQKNETTPQELLSLSEEDLHNLLLDTVTMMEKSYAGSYIQSVIKAVKSWLAHNGVDIKRQIKIRGAEDTPTLRDERVPTNDELRRIFLSGDKKTRTASVLVAHTGMRIKTIGNYQGNDGLRVRDIPEMEINKQTIKFESIPTLVIVRRELSKAGHQYITFLSEEGCDYLKDYLETRMREGEELSSDSAIITPKQKMKPFIRATNVGDVIRSAIRKAGFSWRPYVLRSYFDTQLMLAESKGLVLRDYRQFWMGHKGDIENRYTTNKGMLSENVIEDMRDAYKRSQEYLQTTKKEVDDEIIKLAFREQLLLSVGFTKEEVDRMDLESLEDEDIQTMLKKRLLGEKTSSYTKQMVVAMDNVDQFLNEGWEYVASLQNNNVILKNTIS
jgi:integrase